MGYSSSVTGEMRLSRTLTPEETAKVQPALNDGWSIWGLSSGQDLYLRWEDEVKAIGYGWEKVLQRIVDALPSGVTVTGMFEAEGERDGDGYAAERLYVTHPERRVVVVKPVVTWPDVPSGARA